MVTYLSHIEDDSHDLLDSMEKNILGIGPEEHRAFKRIAEMEEIYDRVSSGNKDADDLKTLEAYYTSNDWKFDHSLDEKGLLPANLKCGVLSEDGIYNILN